MLKKVEKDTGLRDLADAYRSLKLSIEAREQEFKEALREDKATLEILESDLLQEMGQRGLTSCKFGKDVPHYLQGTLYINHRMSCKVEDTEKFFEYVLITEQVDILVARANEKFVKEYIEEHKEPPPGVVVGEIQKLAFRKAQ